MHNNELTRAEVRSVIATATHLVHAGDLTNGTAALAPLLMDVSHAVAGQSYSPFESIDWHEVAYSELLKAWRDGIKEWRDAGFEGLTPGQIALMSFLDSVAEEGQIESHVNMKSAYRNTTARHFLRSVAKQVYGDRAHAALLEDAVLDQVIGRWHEEAMKEGIPSGIYAELCWVPGWDGEDTEDMVDRLALRSTRYRGSYMNEILPSDSLEQLLRWLNISSADLIETTWTYRSQDAAQFAENMKGFSVEVDASCRPLVSAQTLIDIIENAGTTLPVPMAHCMVDLAALFSLDPRLPIELPTEKGIMHIGMHDPIHGSGYMDTYPGTMVIPPMSLGYAWAGRWRYGVCDTYGLVTRPFKCVPTNQHEPARLACVE